MQEAGGLMSIKIVKKYTYDGFGFPVILSHVPCRLIRDVWTPFVSFEKLAQAVLYFLCCSEEPLTGNQVFFIRQHMELTGDALAEVLGVTQAAVSKWEKKGNQIAKIEPAIEFCLRLAALNHLEKGGIELLTKNFLDKHLLSHIKEKQKDEDFSPSPVIVSSQDGYNFHAA
jgi:transcriptional regulator with XRE-family HTH domain